MNAVTGIDTSAPKCNLCSKPYLFIVSIGGRTGSTTVLNMLNAIPNIRLAGENGGQMEMMTGLYETSANLLGNSFQELYCPNPNNEKGGCGAFQRGAVSPTNILCDLASYVDDIAVPVFALETLPHVNVRGFKDIHWNVESLNMLHTVFPCARIVYSIRTNNNSSELIKAYMTDLHLTKSDAEKVMVKEGKLQNWVQAQHEQNWANNEKWKSFWLPLENLNASTFNHLLTWLGVTGCNFSGVVHANGGRLGYSMTGGTPIDAMRLLKGHCMSPFDRSR